MPQLWTDNKNIKPSERDRAHNIFVISLSAECKLQLKTQASVDRVVVGMQ